MSATWLRLTAAMTAALALAGGATACGGGNAERGDAQRTVKVGGIFDLSGGTADIGTPYAEGIRGFVEDWNERGRRPRIDLISEDYKYDVEVAKVLYSSLEREGVVALQGWGTRDTEALSDQVRADNIPFMSASYSESLAEPSRTPFNFVAGTTYSDQMRISLRYIREAGRVTVASFHHDSRFGTSPQAAGRRMARQLGLGFRAYKMADGAEHFSAQLRRAHAQGATYVVIQNTSTEAGLLARDIGRLAPDMKIVCLNWCADELYIEIAGQAAAGTVGVMPFAPASVHADGLAAPRAFLAQSGGSVDQEGLHYVQGWYTMAVLAKGIERAAERVKGAITGASIRQALEEMDAFDTGDISAPVDFSAESHAGMHAAKLFVVKDEQWAKLTGLRPGS
jgi:branched-chain amino acid transport system substrate-binding protein